MKYVAIFVGGPLDHQVRCLDSIRPCLKTADIPIVTYKLVYSNCEDRLLLYSMFDENQTFRRLLEDYVGVE